MLKEAKLSSSKTVDLFLPSFVLREIDRHVDGSQVNEKEKDIGQSISSHSNKCQVCKATKLNEINDLVQKVRWHDQVVKSGKFNFQGCKFIVNNKINVKFMEQMLVDYSDKQVCKFLQFGFPISFQGDMSVFDSMDKWKYKNHKGAEDYPDQMNEYFGKEIKSKSIIGPFKDNPFCTPIVVSPLNSIPKKDVTERRVILDLSFPKGRSLNDFVKKYEYLNEEVQLIFPKVDDFVKLVSVKGKGALMFKKDLRKAYRQIPIDPGDYHLVTYYWRKHLFCDTVLSMGLRNAAYICQRVTTAVAFIMFQLGVAILNYLDDMAGVESKVKADFAYR